MLNKEIIDIAQWPQNFGLTEVYSNWGEDVIIARGLKLSERINSIWTA